MRILVLALLTGCAIIKPDYYQSVSTAEICHGLYTLPSLNVNHPARLRELERRGASCGHPAEIGAAQRDADRLYGGAIRSLTEPPPRANCTTYKSGAYYYTTCS